jgi:hypothetical protein
MANDDEPSVLHRGLPDILASREHDDPVHHVTMGG